MLAKTSRIHPILLCLALGLLALGSGCSNSGGSSEPASSGAGSNTPTLTLSTPSGFTALVADGQSTIPIRFVATNQAKVGMANVPVTFSTTAGSLASSPVVRSSDAATRAEGDTRLSTTTDATGSAQVLLTAGTRVTTAVVTADALGFRTNIPIALVAGPAARVQVLATATTLNAGATTTVTASVIDANGNPRAGEGVNFSLSTNSSNARLDPTSGTTDSDGLVSTMYTAGAFGGIDTIRAASSSASVAASTSITVTGPPGGGAARGIVLTTLTQASIGVRSSGANETTTLTFEARDGNGNPIRDASPGVPNSGTTVRFTLVSGGVGGGETLSPVQATTAQGQVTTTLQSGSKAGTVRVLAFIDANGNNTPDTGEVTSEAVSVVIAGGLPWGENLSIAVLPLNIAGLRTFGLRSTITPFLSDRFSNPVPDGTAVSFFSNFAGITGAAVSNSQGGTQAATAPGTLTSQGPLPPDGFVTVTPATVSGVDARVLVLAVHPTNANLVYAGTDGGGVFRSTNALNTAADQVAWTHVGRAQTGLTNGLARDIKIDPTTPNVLYVATDEGVFRSRDGGDLWTPRSGRERITSEVLGRLTTTTAPQAFPLTFLSDGNRARTVVRVDNIQTLLYEFVGPQRIQLLPGAGQVGGTVSIDYDLGAVIGTGRVTSLALDPTTPLSTDPATTRTLYAGTQGGGVFRSTNSGFSWGPINTGLASTNIVTLVALSPSILYAGTFGDGVFRTTNANEAVPVWCAVNNGLSSTIVNTLATDGTRVYAGTFGGGVFLLPNGTDPNCAATWQVPMINVNTVDMQNGFVNTLAIDPRNAATIYAATVGDGTAPIEGNAAEGGLFRSTDSGVTWVRIPPVSGTTLALPSTDLPSNRVFALSFARGTTDILFVGTAGRHITRLAPATGAYTVIDGAAPNQLTNNIFVSSRVLFSGTTNVTITELSDVFRDANRALPPTGFGPLPDATIFNTGSQFFVYTVADQHGNPLTAGSSINVSVSGGQLTGTTAFSLPDTQRGGTVFGVTWLNNVTASPNNTPLNATLTVSVSSAANGDATARLSRALIPPVSLTPTTGTLPGRGGRLDFTVRGGSETAVSVGGGL